VDWKAVDHDPLVVERDPCSHCWARFACGSACRLTGVHRNYPAESLDRVACQLNEYLVEQNMHLIAQTALRYGTLDPLISTLVHGDRRDSVDPTLPPRRSGRSA
jgi:sulfatase maturation enzyme AslB (radical SAM superfamily)